MATVTLRGLNSFTLLFLVLASAGCWTERVIWSPDGQRAVIVGSHGLYLSDNSGTLVPLLDEHVSGAAWLDARRLLLVRRVPIRTFSALSSALGPERTGVLTQKAEAIWAQLRAGIDTDALLTDMDFWDEEAEAVTLYLLDRYRDEMVALLGDEMKGEDEPDVVLHSLSLAQLEGDRLLLGPPLHQDLDEIVEVRPSPDGTLIAFLSQAATFLGSRGDLTLYVVRADGSCAPAMVAEHVVPDTYWTPAGHAIVYLNGPEFDGAYMLGTLQQAVVSATPDGLGIAEQFLARVVFTRGARVRSLADGRVVFTAVESAFPSTGDDPAVVELFIMDRRGTKPVLTKLLTFEQRRLLPDSLSLFEISPDGRHLLVPDGTEILLLSVADGTVQRIATDLEHDANIPVPSWRGPGEFSYVRKIHGRPELVLRRNGADIVLSGSWPDDVVLQLVR